MRNQGCKKSLELLGGDGEINRVCFPGPEVVWVRVGFEVGLDLTELEYEVVYFLM